MNFNLIAIGLLIVSFSSLAFMVFKKMPELKEVNEPDINIFRKETRKKIKERTREILKNNTSSFENVLHKLLSKIRILSLKTDKLVSGWITSLRKRSVERKTGLDNYWKEIKHSMGKKD